MIVRESFDTLGIVALRKWCKTALEQEGCLTYGNSGENDTRSQEESFEVQPLPNRISTAFSIGI